MSPTYQWVLSDDRQIHAVWDDTILSCAFTGEPWTGVCEYHIGRHVGRVDGPLTVCWSCVGGIGPDAVQSAVAWADVVSSHLAGASEDDPGQRYVTHRYSVIPDKDGTVHAVLDRIVRAVFHNGTYQAGLAALCGEPVHPASWLPVQAKLCAGCEDKARTFPGVLVPRPAPGNPLLEQMAALHPGGAR